MNILVYLFLLNPVRYALVLRSEQPPRCEDNSTCSLNRDIPLPSYYNGYWED